jgi:aryl-alcohol dehydrogenase-like predicted oxidoreductase
VGSRNGPGANEVGHNRVHLMNAIEASLRRLGTDRIDLLQLHAHDPLNPFEDTLRTLDDAVTAGKVRYIGCSNLFAWQLVKARALSASLGYEKFASVQAYYSVAGRDIERELIPAVLDQRIGLLTWCPLAGGLLTGKYARKRQPAEPSRRLKFDFPPVLMERAYGVIDVLEAVACRHDATVAQVALAWQFQQPAVTAAIVGARSEEQLAENVKSVALDLTPEDLQQIDAVSRLPSEYPQWYHDLPLGRRPGEGRGLGRNLGN